MRNWMPIGYLSLLLVLVFGLAAQSLFFGVVGAVITVTTIFTMHWFGQITADWLVAAVSAFRARLYTEGAWKLFFAVVFFCAALLTLGFALGLVFVIV